ncbi:hypothetical protein ACJZ2D_011082 [Fusarium nematophilum]
MVSPTSAAAHDAAVPYAATPIQSLTFCAPCTSREEADSMAVCPGFFCVPNSFIRSYTSRDIGWITGVYVFLALLCGIQAGPLMDAYGATYLAPVAAMTVILMFFLLSECTQYWHFMLCLGVLGGIGGAIAATVSLSVIGKLFVQCKGLAMGLALTGASTGAVIWPLMLRSLLPSRGWKFSLRIVGFATAGFMLLGVVCLLPYKHLLLASTGQNAVLNGDQESRTSIRRQHRKAMVNFSAFRIPSFFFISTSLFLLEFAIYGVTGLLPTLVEMSGFSADSGYVMITILNGCSCLGRIIPGVIGDRVGHFNVLILMIVITFVCTAATLVPFGGRYIQAVYVFSGLWGFGSGSFLSLTPICMGKTCEPKDYGRFLGTMHFVVSFSQLISVPIGGQMLDSLGVTALAGLYLAMVCLGGVSAFASRSLLLGTWFTLEAMI